MASLSFLALVVLVLATSLIGNSLALQCHECKKSGCKTTTCPEALKKVEKDATLICMSFYPGKVGENGEKGCMIAKDFVKLSGGSGKCAKVPGSKVETAINDTAEAIAIAILTQTLTREDIVEIFKDAKPGDDTQPDPATDYIVCSCDSDLCNSDKGDKARNKATAFQKSVNHVTVTVVMLALVLALTQTSSGFVESQ